MTTPEWTDEDDQRVAKEVAKQKAHDEAVDMVAEALELEGFTVKRKGEA